MPASPTQPMQMTDQLRRIVSRGTLRWRWLVAIEATSLLVALPLMCLWILFVLDNLLHLPAWARVAGSAAFVLGAVWGGHMLVRRWRRQWAMLTEDRVALAIERGAATNMQNRLINALQLGRASGEAARGANGAPQWDQAYCRAVVHENYDALQHMMIGQPTKFTRAGVSLALAAVAVSIGLSFWNLQPEYFSNAATRILLPLSNVEPIYRTRLEVAPGDVEISPGQSVPVRIYVHGVTPGSITISTRGGADGGQREQARLALSADQRAVTHMLENVHHDTRYSVIGGDYTAPRRGAYLITVLAKPKLRYVAATIHRPAYLARDKQQPRTLKSRSGDLEAVFGSRAEVSFHLDQAVTSASLLLDRSNEHKNDRKIVSLTRKAEDVFAGEFAFENVSAYTLQVRIDETTHELGPYRVRVLGDEPPRLELSGISDGDDLDLDAVHPLSVRATDDHGLRDVQLCAWPVPAEHADGDEVTLPDTAPNVLDAWSGDGKQALDAEHDLLTPVLGGKEGDRFVIALRGRDHNPHRNDDWVTGELLTVRVVSEGSTLQLLYDQLLATEASIRAQSDGLNDVQNGLTPWLVKLDASSDVRWDDAEVLASLRDAMDKQAQAVRSLREKMAAAAKQVAAPANSLQVSLAMLADTEMVRLVRILDAVADREHPQQKRQALVDARTVIRRIDKSLERILGQHIQIRQDWELAHMIGYVEMLAKRQSTLANASARHAKSPPLSKVSEKVSELLPTSAARRQSEMGRLCTLASEALARMARHVGSDQETLSSSFAAASKSLKEPALTEAIKQSVADAKAGSWSSAASMQSDAAERLAAIHSALHEAKQRAVEQVFAQYQQRAESTVEEQGAIDQLSPGTSENLVTGDRSNASLDEIVRIARTAGDDKRHELDTNDWIRPSGTPGDADSATGENASEADHEQPFDQMRLSDRPGNQKSFPDSDGRPRSQGKLSLIDEPYQDLVGDLLETADDLREKYETYNLNAQGQGGVEGGTVSKNSGDLNAFSAAAATGNQKPPTHDVGGASRVGRGGGRAHGEVVGDKMRSMRGMDEAMQGQKRTAFQEGSIEEILTDDPQKDMATGYGGKQVDTEEVTSFSTKDRGKWDNVIAEKALGDAKKTQKIVERRGEPIDPEVAKMLRDLESDTEQVIERIKTVRKQFDELYLPTEHLDEVMDRLNANLDRLKEQPEPEVFRQQVQALDHVRSIASVYHHASSGFQMSLQRKQSLKGRILDERPQPALPGYEEAVHHYYEGLAQQ
ncbi:MAG: hypothetical protein ACOC9P_00155 [bacterium]